MLTFALEFQQPNNSCSPQVLNKATGAVAMIYKFNKASLNKHLL